MANTMYNLEEMAQSLSCGQDQARSAMGRLATAAKQPFVTAKEALNKAMSAVKAGVQRLRDSVNFIERIVSSVIGVIKSAGSWLSAVVNVCNRKIGTPTERCFNVFVNAAHDCSAHLGPLFSWLCSVVYIVSIVCLGLAWIGLLCKLIHMVSDAVVDSVKRMGSRFTAYIRTAMYVDVEFHHSFHVDMDTKNKTLKSIAKAIGKELKQSTCPISRFYNMVGGVLGLTWIIVFIKALQYHHKFMTSDRFDNVYVTRHLKQVDVMRAKRGLECVLPLRRAERSHFCRPTQLHLLAHEKKQLTRSILFLFMTTFNLTLLLNVDYGLFWLLDHLRSQATFLTHIPSMQSIQLQVEGDGLVADMFRNITSSLNDDENVAEAPPEIDPAACLPNPMQPDINTYYKIMVLMIVAWTMVLAEPLVLRLRPTILNVYHPKRAQQRAVWLCGHILRERGGILRTIARLVGRRKSQGGAPREPLQISSLLERLKDKSALVRMLLGSKSRAACVICATPESADDILFKCGALGCSAKYCATCFSSQDNLCHVCTQPLEQPEIPGLLLEVDSSDEEVKIVVMNTCEGEKELASLAQHDEPPTLIILDEAAALVSPHRGSTSLQSNAETTRDTSDSLSGSSVELESSDSEYEGSGLWQKLRTAVRGVRRTSARSYQRLSQQEDETHKEKSDS